MFVRGRHPTKTDSDKKRTPDIQSHTATQLVVVNSAQLSVPDKHSVYTEPTATRRTIFSLPQPDRIPHAGVVCPMSEIQL